MAAVPYLNQDKRLLRLPVNSNMGSGGTCCRNMSDQMLTWGVKLWDDTNSSSLSLSNDLLHLQPQDPGAQQRLLCPWRMRGTVCLPHQANASSISAAPP